MEGHADFVGTVAACSAGGPMMMDSALQLQIAAQKGDVAALRKLIAGGVGVDATIAVGGPTPLCLAASSGNVPAVRALNEASADANKATGNGTMPAFAAASKGHTEALALVLSAPGFDASANSCREDGMTALVAAASRGDTASL